MTQRDGRRILLVAPCSPFSPRSGAGQRTALLYHALAQICETDVLLVAPTGDAAHAEATVEPRILAALYWKEWRFAANKYRPDAFVNGELSARGIHLDRYSLIVGKDLNPICKLSIPDNMPTIVDLDDWGKTYSSEGEISLHMILGLIKKRYGLFLARRQLKRFGAFFFVSKRDRDREPRLLSGLLPNIPFSVPGHPVEPASGKNILFVGALWYAPNVDGVNHFIEHCWQRVRSVVPDATLTLVGEAPPAARKKWDDVAGVRAVGFVENLGDAYRSASFSIAPVYFGGGTNIKIIESLAFSRACITTPHGAGAFADDLVARGGLAVAQSDAEFSELCIFMLTHPEERDKQASIGFSEVMVAYNKSVFENAVIRLVENVAGL